MSGKAIQLKKVYLLKPIMVAAGHSLQWFAFTGRTSPIVLLLALCHFLDTFVSTSLLDANDAKLDELEGVRTLPVVHGFMRTMDILLVVSAAWLVSGLATAWAAASLPLTLFLLPRAVVMSYRLGCLRAGRSARIPAWIDHVPLRVVGVVGIALHGWTPA